jgi:hypothetical protein
MPPTVTTIALLDIVLGLFVAMVGLRSFIRAKRLRLSRDRPRD